jgi:hypothetical protein
MEKIEKKEQLERSSEESSKNEFNPTISRITKPLGVRAGMAATVKVVIKGKY